jgi:hypothetical protein
MVLIHSNSKNNLTFLKSANNSPQKEWGPAAGNLLEFVCA